MPLPRKEFLQKLYELVAAYPICSQCHYQQVIKNQSEPCTSCGAIAWKQLSFEDDFLYDIEIIFDRNHDGHDSEPLSEYLSGIGIGKVEAWSDARRNIVESLERFSDPRTAQWIAEHSHTDHDSVAFILDDLYTREFLNKAAELVDRTMRISVMAPKATPESGVNLYLREASRCFIYGFWNSSVALSRAALELGLKQQLKSRLGGYIPTDDDLNLLLEYAHQWRLIDDAVFKMGDQVRKQGNNILHGSHADEKLAWDSLWAVRGVLKSIYSRK